jgi:hypothetical protein
MSKTWTHLAASSAANYKIHAYMLPRRPMPDSPAWHCRNTTTPPMPAGQQAEFAEPSLNKTEIRVKQTNPPPPPPPHTQPHNHAQHLKAAIPRSTPSWWGAGAPPHPDQTPHCCSQGTTRPVAMPLPGPARPSEAHAAPRVPAATRPVCSRTESCASRASCMPTSRSLGGRGPVCVGQPRVAGEHAAGRPGPSSSTGGREAIRRLPVAQQPCVFSSYQGLHHKGQTDVVATGESRFLFDLDAPDDAEPWTEGVAD